MQVLPITEKRTVSNYPYGRLRTDAFFSVEFQPKKGFRSVFQTINPKNGRINAEKKSTYYTFMCQRIEEGTGHVKTKAINVGGYEDVNTLCAFVAEHYDALALTPDMVKHLLVNCAVSIKASAHWTAADKTKLLALLDKPINTLFNGAKTGTNVFAEVSVDVEAIRTLEKEFAEANPNFSFFKVTSSFVIGG